MRTRKSSKKYNVDLLGTTSSEKRDMKSLPENITKAMNEINRDLNYMSRPRSIIVYGETGSGKSFAINQLAHHINELPSLVDYREVQFLNKEHIQSILNDVEADEIDSDDLFAGMIEDANNVNKNDRHLIIVIDDFHLALALSDKCRNTSFIIEMGEDDMMHALSDHESEMDKMEPVYVDNAIKWSELLNEMAIANSRFDKSYPCTAMDAATLKAFVEELILQVYPSRSASFKKSDEIEVPIGYIIDQLEYAYVRALEPPYDKKKPTVRTARMLAKEAFQCNPLIDEDDFMPVGGSDTDPIASLLSDEMQPHPARGKKKPVKPLKYNDPLHLDDRLKKTVINQDKAVDMVARAIMIDAAKMKPKNKPVASFLFLGPSGVGKTQLAKSLASTLFEKPVNLVRIDCSEFSEKHTVSRLFGAPPGYVGFDNGGELTNAVREHPQSVVLLDEVEKAHTDVWNTFLQVFDDARLTDGQGQVTDFSHCIFILTGNLGTKEADSIKTAGFGESNANDEEAVYAKSMKDFFRPEFINRLDGICYFNRLRRSDYVSIVNIKLDGIASIIKDNYNADIDFIVDDEAVDDILKKAKSLNHGAREIEQVLKTSIILPLSEKILSEDISFSGKRSIEIHDNNGDLMLTVNDNPDKTKD